MAETATSDQWVGSRSTGLFRNVANTGVAPPILWGHLPAGAAIRGMRIRSLRPDRIVSTVQVSGAGAIDGRTPISHPGRSLLRRTCRPVPSQGRTIRGVARRARRSTVTAGARSTCRTIRTDSIETRVVRTKPTANSIQRSGIDGKTRGANEQVFHSRAFIRRSNDDEPEVRRSTSRGRGFCGDGT